MRRARDLSATGPLHSASTRNGIVGSPPRHAPSVNAPKQPAGHSGSLPGRGPPTIGRVGPSRNLLIGTAMPEPALNGPSGTYTIARAYTFTAALAGSTLSEPCSQRSLTPLKSFAPCPTASR